MQPFVWALGFGHAALGDARFSKDETCTQQNPSKV
jgi:hypothetical protein